MRNFLFGASVMNNVVEGLIIYILWMRLGKVDPKFESNKEKEDK